MTASSSTPSSVDQAVAASAAYFQAIPWCAARLTSASEPVTFYTPPWDGKTKFGDSFFAKTLNTELTVPHLLLFYNAPSPAASDGTDGAPALIPELQAFLHMESGVGGHPGYAHGGFLCTVLDEVTGLLITLNRHRGAALLDRRPSMTGFLNTRFLRPVRAPGVALVRARIVRHEGRKTWVEGWLEDENGLELVRAEAVFLALKQKL